MKLQKVKEIKKIYSVVKAQGKLIVSSTNKNIGYYNSDTLELEQKLEDHIKILNTFKFDSSIFYISTRNELFRQDGGSISPFLKERIRLNVSQIKEHIVLYKGKVFNKEYSVYSLRLQKKIWGLNNIPLEIIESYCFQLDYTFFKARNIETGEILWSKTITDDFPEATGYKFKTVYNKVLIIAINDTTLAGYHVDTGELLWSVNKTNNRNLLVDNDGKLKGVISTGYFETDIQTGIHRRIEFAPFEAIKEPGWFESQRDNFVIIDKHIITTDFYSNRIGGFNMETQQYDWFYTEENATGFPASRPIKYFAPYLCLIDNNDTLHIYNLNNNIA